MTRDITAEQEYEDYLNEQNRINTELPNAKFTISIDYDKLDNVISMQRIIYILVTKSCYCYGDNPMDTQIFKITSNNVITNRLVLKELIKKELVLDCNHSYVEGFHMLNNNSNIFEIMTGS